MKSAVFLDRDGVINRSIIRHGRPYPPRTLNELLIYEDVARSVQVLRRYGFEVVIITNQPDVARGDIAIDVLNKINETIMEKTGIEHFYMCLHVDEDKCDCRKPKPGMLFAAERELNIDLKSSYLVGDRWRDIEAGKRANCTTFFIDHSYREKKPEEPFITVNSLEEAAGYILSSISNQHLGRNYGS